MEGNIVDATQFDENHRLRLIDAEHHEPATLTLT